MKVHIQKLEVPDGNPELTVHVAGAGFQSGTDRWGAGFTSGHAIMKVHIQKLEVPDGNPELAVHEAGAGLQSGTDRWGGPVSHPSMP